MSNAYDAIARFYDGLMKGFDYEAYADYVATLTCGGTALDLACGSGKISCLLAEKGFSVVGVDKSASMLRQAQQNAIDRKLKIRFVQRDMVKTVFNKKFSLITIVCDGVNYVAPSRLPRLFANAYSMLEAGGVLVFDVSTAYKLTQVIGDGIFYEDYDDLSLFWRNKVSPKGDRLNMDITVFEADGDKYLRYDEKQTQYVHQKAELTKMLLQCGFSEIVKVDGRSFRAPYAKSARLVFSARKLLI